MNPRFGPFQRASGVFYLEDTATPAEGAQGVLDAAHQVLRLLTEERLAVGLARIAQDHTQDPRPAARAVLRVDDPTSMTEIDLRLLAGFDLHAPHPLRLCPAQTSDETLHRLIAATESDLGDQILMDALGGEAKVEFGTDELGVGLAPRIVRSTMRLQSTTLPDAFQRRGLSSVDALRDKCATLIQ